MKSLCRGRRPRRPTSLPMVVYNNNVTITVRYALGCVPYRAQLLCKKFDYGIMIALQSLTAARMLAHSRKLTLESIAMQWFWSWYNEQV